MHRRFVFKRRVGFYHRHRLTTTLAASKVETTDVHLVLAEDRPDASDHAGNILVAVLWIELGESLPLAVVSVENHNKFCDRQQV